MEVISCGYLFVLGVRDIAKRSVPVWWLVIGGTVMVGMGIYKCAIGATELINLLTGILPGAIFCLLARITGKVGYGDGVLLMELGICFGYHRIMLLLCVSLMLMAILSILLLAMHKVKKDTKVPFFPMLAMVFLFVEVLGG